MVSHLTTHTVCMLPSLASHTPRYRHGHRTPCAGHENGSAKLANCFRLCAIQKQAQHQLHASPFCSLTRPASNFRYCRQRQRVVKAEMQLDNRELLVGDCLSLVSFCLYKQVNNTAQCRAPLSCSTHTRKSSQMSMYAQITAIILTPSFPGWLAPMHFNPTRFEEFLSFAITVCGTWVGASWLVGGYKANATSGDPISVAVTPL